MQQVFRNISFSVILFSLVVISGTAFSQTNYSGIWLTGDADYKVWSDANWKSFHAKWDELRNQNYRLVDIETILGDGERRYFGIWHSGFDLSRLWVGINWFTFKEKWDEARADGLRLVDVEIYHDRQGRKFIGVWREGFHDEEFVFDQTWDNFQKKWNELNEANFRLIDFEIYYINGDLRYAGVWQSGESNDLFLHDLPWDKFEEINIKLSEGKMRLVDLEMHPVSKGVKSFSGLWYREAGSQRILAEQGWNAFLDKIRSWPREGYALVDLETESRESVFYAGAGDASSSSTGRNDYSSSSSGHSSSSSNSSSGSTVSPPPPSDDTSGYIVAGGEERGKASYYADKFHGRKTASGELYDKNAMTTAHRTHAFGTLLKVTNETTGQSVVVRVNDRGPHVPSRVVDLSRAAAVKVDAITMGIIDVVVVPVVDPNAAQNNTTADNSSESTSGSSTTVASNTSNDNTSENQQSSSSNTSSSNSSSAEDVVAAGKVESGKASYYADKFHGRKTASGELYDRNKMTCAHRTHPFGTLLKVTNEGNNRSVVVRVNDRGPHSPGRIVDLSNIAAQQIGLIQQGIAEVKVVPVKIANENGGGQSDLASSTSSTSSNSNDSGNSGNSSSSSSSSSDGDIERGKASYYANKFNGRRTASGEIFDQNKLTCAHRTHPFGTYLKVTNVDNGLSVIVRVNDRGPHVPSRVVDLSAEAADRLDAIRLGIIDVEVEVVSNDEAEN